MSMSNKPFLSNKFIFRIYRNLWMLFDFCEKMWQAQEDIGTDHDWRFDHLIGPKRGVPWWTAIRESHDSWTHGNSVCWVCMKVMRQAGSKVLGSRKLVLLLLWLVCWPLDLQNYQSLAHYQPHLFTIDNRYWHKLILWWVISWLLK